MNRFARDFAIFAVVSLTSVGALVGCNAPLKCPDTAANAKPAASPGPSVNDADRESLLQADRDFDAATNARGIDGWVEFFADDGAQMADKRDLVVGKEAIRAYMGPVLSKPNRKLRWAPERGEVSGNVGWTMGRARLLELDPKDGTEKVLGHFKYLTTWRRVAGGPWRVVLDIGNDDP